MDAETINRKIHEWLGKSWYEVKQMLNEHATLTAQPAESVEDAKALEDAIEQLTQDANFAEAIGQASDRAFAADLRTVINAARSREQYAAKQIERQTPAIIERFVEEVEKKVNIDGLDRRADDAGRIWRLLKKGSGEIK